ncbi:hypothetical protein D6855_14125 [Butyrivibrio sp. CB08]|uniref:hypothetical protein n=1 Tax=Butyrivibrio sp. CB08 TaxID=2364879 RepID=UPI000EAA90E2|nr:hypothetical protein [Butyrivibrio sp. CB08]RKM56802.1 hypothetical protein D6855_14125 [Butyrivibrio sp. CB08]
MVKDLYVASCVYDGTPMMAVGFVQGYIPCPECGRMMYVKAKYGKVTVTDVSDCPEYGEPLRSYIAARNERRHD